MDIKPLQIGVRGTNSSDNQEGVTLRQDEVALLQVFNIAKEQGVPVLMYKNRAISLYLADPELSVALMVELAGALRLLTKNPRILKKKGWRALFKKSDYDEEWLEAQCHAFLELIADKINREYKQTRDGLKVYRDAQGHLIVNGLNVSLFLKQEFDFSNPMTRVYFTSLQEKLFIILMNYQYASFHDIVRQADDDLRVLLKKIPKT